MKIVIVGAGFTGVQLAKRLIAEKNDVVLVDSDEETVRHASNRLDCMVMQADGNSLHTLESAGIAKADALVMLTPSDEVNMITCSLVDSVYPDVVKIARVRNDAYYADSEVIAKTATSRRPLYGIDFMVHPDDEAAQAIVSAVEHGAVTEVLDFDNSPYELTHITVESKSRLDGALIQDIRKLVDCRFLVAYVESPTETSLPSGATILQADDRLGILTERQNIPLFLELCGSKLQELNKIALVGAGRIGSGIAEKIFKQSKPAFMSRFFGVHRRLNQEFVIIDMDEGLAKEASERFPGAKVFRADITDEGFIEEEGLASFDLVINATHNHELNMVSSAYFKSLGVSKTICLVASEGFATMARNIGVDVAVPIKDAVVDSIMSHLRGKSVFGVHTIGDGEIEIVEAEVPAGSDKAGKSLKEVAMPGVFLLLMIRKNNATEYTIPDGNTVLESGDGLVLIAYSKDNRLVMDRLTSTE